MNLFSNQRQRQIIWGATAVLLVLGAAWTGWGFRHLLAQKTPAVDFHMRWLEQRYVYNGQNPYDVVALARAQKFNLPLPNCPRDNHIDPEIGTPYIRQGGYPPWAFVTSALMVLPSRWLYATSYFALLDALALAITFAWAYRIGRPQGRIGGVFLGAAALAISAHFRALQVGQYGIIVNAMLIGVYYLVQRARPCAAGVLYGMALLKPQISALFALSFLVKRQWRLLAAATGYVVLASLLIWWVTKTNPIEMSGQMYALAQSWVDHPDPHVQQQIQLGHSTFLQLLLNLDVDRKVATPLAAGVGLLLGGSLFWIWRRGSTLTHFAIAATVGRLWTYHHGYDDVMLIFLLVPLGQLVLKQRSPATSIAFCLVGFSLWPPMSLGTYPLVLHIAQMASWLFGLSVVLAWEPRFGKNEAPQRLHDDEMGVAADKSARPNRPVPVAGTPAAVPS